MTEPSSPDPITPERISPERYAQVANSIEAEIGKLIVGQGDVVRTVLLALVRSRA